MLLVKRFNRTTSKIEDIDLMEFRGRFSSIKPNLELYMFREEVRKTLMGWFHGVCEWELIIDRRGDRIYLRNWPTESVEIDVTDDDSNDWVKLATNLPRKLSVYDQVVESEKLDTLVKSLYKEKIMENLKKYNVGTKVTIVESGSGIEKEGTIIYYSIKEFEDLKVGFLSGSTFISEEDLLQWYTIKPTVNPSIEEMLSDAAAVMVEAMEMECGEHESCEGCPHNINKGLCTLLQFDEREDQEKATLKQILGEVFGYYERTDATKKLTNF